MHTWIATSDGSMQSIVAIRSPVSRIRDLQQFLGDLRVVPHHRDEHGRLVVPVHSFGQAGLRVDQLEGELPVPAADGVVQRVEPALVLRLDRLAQPLVTAAPEDERGQGDVAAGHGGEQRRLAVSVDGAEKRRRPGRRLLCWSSAPGRPCRTSRGHGCRRCGGRCSPEELFPAAPPGSAGPCASFPRSCRTRLRPGDVGGLPVILMVVESWELLMMNSSWLLHRRVCLWQLLSN